MKPYYLIFVLMIVCGCIHSDNDTDYVSRLYSERDITFDNDTEFCIVLPEVGCSGCISGVIYNIIDHKSAFSSNQKRNLIVFTSVNSMKMLLRNVQVDSLSELNCIVDMDNKYLLDTNDKIYPVIMTLDKGKISNVMIQSPDNLEDAFLKYYKE